MLIGIFKSNQKLVNLLSVLLVIIMWFPSFFIDSSVSSSITTGVKWLDVFIGIIFISTQSIYLNFIASEYKLVKDNSHVTSLIFVLLNSCFLWILKFNEVIIVNTIVLIAFHQILRIDKARANYAISFNVGFLIGLASLIYFPSIVFLLLLLIAFIYMTMPSWREFVVAFIGLCIPIIYMMVYKFVLGGLESISMDCYLPPLFVVSGKDFTLYNKMFLGAILIVLLGAFLNLFITINTSVVKTSKILVLVLLMFVLGLATVFLNEYDFTATFIVVSVPLAIIIANFFQNIKKQWLAELVFSCLLLSVLIGYFS